MSAEVYLARTPTSKLLCCLALITKSSSENSHCLIPATQQLCLDWLGQVVLRALIDTCVSLSIHYSYHILSLSITMSSKLMSSRSNEAYKLAHTARCKLHIAAKEPDRNLRFLLGHAFTLDKLMLRVAEIETSSDDDEEMKEARMEEGETAAMPRCTRGEEPTASAPRRASVTFKDNSNRPSGELRQEVEPGNGAVNDRRRSPPPTRFEHLDDTDSDSSNDEYYEDEEEDGAGLQRFESAAAQPPRMIADDGSDEEDDEPKSPPGLTDDELKAITEGEINEELAELYEKVAGCPCHGVKGPAAGKVWEIPQKPGVQGPRMAVIQVEA